MSEHLPDSVRDQIQSGYRQFLASKQLKPRLGQKQMIAAIANTLSRTIPGSRLAAIEAGTGTGKTVGYLMAALPIAKAAGKTVVVATGTVALQEQLVERDLPDLLQACGWDYHFALVKGRGRYVCNLRLEQAADTARSRDQGLYLFEDELAFNPDQKTMALYRELSEGLEDGSWNGQRDSWPDRLSEIEWRPLTIDRRQCAGRRCRHINECAFYTARNELDESDCIIANHDLVMADLALGGGAILPPPEDCIFIFDEGHRLGETTVRHFASECRVNATVSWLERMQKQCKGQVPLFEQAPNLVEQLQAIERAAGQLQLLISPLFAQLQRLVDSSDRDDGRYRFSGGDIGSELREQATEIAMQLARWSGRLQVLVDALDEAQSEQHFPVPLADIELCHQQAGSWLSRSEGLLSLFNSLQRKVSANKLPQAVWLAVEHADGGNMDIAIHASPIEAAEILTEQLWNSCYGAIVTSATLRALGKFDELIRTTGIPAEAHFLSVAGAFDYYNKATITVPSDSVEGNQVAEHTDYLIENLPHYFEPAAGTLVLFSSRRQMEEVFDQLDRDTQKQILIQGQYSAREMIRLHKERVDQGKQSMLFGLASFAEGVDLPGDYCRHVVIVKLPFAVPDDPLLEALSEWVEGGGKNSFFTLSLPQASLRLIQACGRLLRTENDSGTVTMLDKRIVSKRYGRDLLDALPPFRREI
ncbi:ATP-dependent DNA helicase DinG [Porticoccaceae bacterium]|nr:ATP-dependent DNA helicase DinG [Porticoccaceae bacterium]